MISVLNKSGIEIIFNLLNSSCERLEMMNMINLACLVIALFFF